ncbi:hypothetical protein GYMLUDRAFT_258993 [Collybiopsis luxurians FD-317 M1]|uniref:Uncharacterized protein n=1 Tax=Collybiopsis luxurians FD-317 M1 TaxID=944289 RepID=A0A0D0BIK4_9AGAR|nr:hypothetical protein GYMLUDRAFT_258993 [Collybiopsis luxurians FD-317 M1]
MLPLSLPIVTGPESNYNTQPVEAWTKIVVGLDYIFLIAGLLGDMILIYRCYRLWNSNKRIIIIPILGLVAVFIVWVINETNIFVTYEVYILTTLGENVLLTGLIAGRVWWQNRKVTKLIGRPDRDASRSQNLLGPILESGSIFPAVLIATVISYQTLYRNFIFEDDFPATFIPQTIIISPCALTQAVGIASTMIMVRIGLGIDSSGPQSRATIRAMDAEARGSEMADIFQQDPYPESISPFRLRYSHLDNYLTDSNVESAPIYLDRPRYTYTPGRKETELRMG